MLFFEFTVVESHVSKPITQITHASVYLQGCGMPILNSIPPFPFVASTALTTSHLAILYP